MTAPYIPSSDAAFDAMIKKFTSEVRLLALPALVPPGGPLFLTGPEVAEISATNADWEVAYRPTAVKGRVLTSVTEAKNLQKATSTKIIRKFQKRFTGITTLSNRIRLNLGLTQLGRKPTRLPVPELPPGFKVENIGARQIQINAFDQARGQNSRKKPDQVKFIRAQVVILGGANLTPEQALYIVDSSRVKFTMSFPLIVAGMRAQIKLQWVMNRGDVSPWSDTLGFIIPNIGVTAAG